MIVVKLAPSRKKSEMSSSDEMEILAPAENIRPEESMFGSRPRGRRLGFSSPNNLRLSTLAVVFSVAYTIYWRCVATIIIVHVS